MIDMILLLSKLHQVLLIFSENVILALLEITELPTLSGF